MVDASATGNPVPVITIDGPSGSGKGTIGESLARSLGWGFLDSGSLYRVLGMAAVERNISLEDGPALARLAAEIDLDFIPRKSGGVQIMLDGRDVGDALRTETAGAAASRVAALPEVRQALLDKQRAYRRPPGLVADGRDMGTTVFADASLKIYLTASAEERAQRRYNQLKQKGFSVNLARLLEEIQARDARDTGRASSPLKPAADAHVIDTTGIPVATVLARVEELVRIQDFART